MLLLELEQCYFCLYGHPNKKAKVLNIIEGSFPEVYVIVFSSHSLGDYKTIVQSRWVPDRHGFIFCARV